MLPEVKDQGQHIMHFGSKIFNNDLNASQYLYICTAITTEEDYGHITISHNFSMLYCSKNN